MHQVPCIAHFCALLGPHLGNGARDHPSSLPTLTPERLEQALVQDADEPDAFLADLHIRLLRGITGTRKITY